MTISSAVVPDREALVSGDGSVCITYEEITARVNRLANALQGMGLHTTRVATMAHELTPGRRGLLGLRQARRLLRAHHRAHRLPAGHAPLPRAHAAEAREGDGPR